MIGKGTRGQRCRRPTTALLRTLNIHNLERDSSATRTTLIRKTHQRKTRHVSTDR